jgi:hypothetical protein
MRDVSKRTVIVGAAATVVASAVPAVPCTKPAWLIAAEAARNAHLDLWWDFGTPGALTVLRHHAEPNGVVPERYDADLLVEFARALRHGMATITPAGTLRITPRGIEQDEAEWLEGW